MPTGARWSYPLVVGLLGILVILEEWLRRRPPFARHDDATARATRKPRERQLGTILLAPIVALGAMWLIPWAAALAISDPAALLPGLLIVVPLLACLRHVLWDTEREE
jgi:hypothetical protein